MGIEILLIFLLIVGNGVFAMSEIAVISARRVRLAKLGEKGNQGALVALRLTEDPNLFLSTVQVGITVVGTLAGVYGGATIAEKLSVSIAGWPRIGPYATPIAFGFVVAVISYLSLILGELVPKRIALSNPERIATLVAKPMQMVSRIASPIVKFLSFSTNMALKLLPVLPKHEQGVTEEEVRAMIALGTKSGVFLPQEREMVEGVFRLGDRRVADLMTPRSKVLWLEADHPISAALEVIQHHPYSRYPVAKGDLDRVIGFIEARDLVGVSDLSARLASKIKKPLFVPEAFPALRLIERFRISTVPVAIVVGEHGDVMGIVTATDLLEAIVGELPQPEEDFEPRVVEREDGSMLVDGLMSIGELKELLRVDDLGPAEDAYNTLGGFVMHELGRIPKIGDQFDQLGRHFEVVDMDGHRVDRVLISAKGSKGETEN